jgi:hypothetical protein
VARAAKNHEAEDVMLPESHPRHVSDGNGGRINLDELSERELLIVTTVKLDRLETQVGEKFKIYDAALFDLETHLANHKFAYIAFGVVSATIALAVDLVAHFV